MYAKGPQDRGNRLPVLAQEGCGPDGGLSPLWSRDSGDAYLAY